MRFTKSASTPAAASPARSVPTSPQVRRSASSLLLAADESLRDEYSGMDHNDSYFLVPTFKLESGRVLTNVRVAYRTWGTLSAAADNCLFVPHALTGNAAVNTWWAALLGEGRALDTSRYFVVCANMLGSCYGTTSPLDTVPKAASWVRSRDGTPAQAAGDRYAGDFPHTTIRDTVRLHQLLVVHELGVRAVHAVVGGSAGGMQALEWAIMYPSLVRRAVVMACCAAQSAWQLAISEVQRQSIYRDPDWNLGLYALSNPNPNPSPKPKPKPKPKPNPKPHPNQVSMRWTRRPRTASPSPGRTRWCGTARPLLTTRSLAGDCSHRRRARSWQRSEP